MSKSKDNSDTFMRRFRKRQAKRVRALCLSVGLATAWGGTQQADADITFDVSIESQVTLNNAYIFFGNNVSSPVIVPIGVIPANQLSSMQITLTDSSYTWQADPSIYEVVVPPPRFGLYFDPRWGVLAEYDEDGVKGVALVLADDESIIKGSQFDSLFNRPGFPYVESSVIHYLETSDFDQLINFSNYLLILGISNPDVQTPLYGQEGILVAFSDASFAGAVTVSIVPEASSFVMLMSTGTMSLLAFIFWRKPHQENAKCLPHCEE